MWRKWSNWIEERTKNSFTVSLIDPEQTSKTKVFSGITKTHRVSLWFNYQVFYQWVLYLSCYTRVALIPSLSYACFLSQSSVTGWRERWHCFASFMMLFAAGMIPGCFTEPESLCRSAMAKTILASRLVWKLRYRSLLCRVRLLSRRLVESEGNSLLLVHAELY